MQSTRRRRQKAHPSWVRLPPAQGIYLIPNPRRQADPASQAVPRSVIKTRPDRQAPAPTSNVDPHPAPINSNLERILDLSGRQATSPDPSNPPAYAVTLLGGFATLNLARSSVRVPTSRLLPPANAGTIKADAIRKLERMEIGRRDISLLPLRHGAPNRSIAVQLHGLGSFCEATAP
jgi:hypothetical protein